MIPSTAKIKKASRKRFTSIEVNISLIAATSFVTRVTSLPTGVLSKYERGRRRTWPNISRRMSYITFCPVSCNR